MKLHREPLHQVPLRAFWDKPFRDAWLQAKWGSSKALPGTLSPSTQTARLKLIRRVRTLATQLMPETEQLLRYLVGRRMRPLDTQVAVAAGRVGTTCDLVCLRPNPTTQEDEHVVCEIKNGCTENLTDDTPMREPFPGFLFTTHREHLLQTMMSNYLYRRTFPAARMAPPQLLRMDREGLHRYAPPEWAITQETALARKMGC